MDRKSKARATAGYAGGSGVAAEGLRYRWTARIDRRVDGLCLVPADSFWIAAPLEKTLGTSELLPHARRYWFIKRSSRVIAVLFGVLCRYFAAPGSPISWISGTPIL